MALYQSKSTKLIIAKWVDDIVVRGNTAESEKFWTEMEKAWDLKGWGFVTADHPRTFCSKRISMEIINGVKWYSIDQEEDIRQWITDMGIMGMRPVKSPMTSTAELYSDLRLLDAHDAKMGTISTWKSDILRKRDPR